MEEIKQLLVNLQQEIIQQKSDILEMKEDITRTINNNINEKFGSLELKNELLEKKIEEQSNKINNLERYLWRKNLVMFGVEEQEKSYHELEEIIINIIKTYFNLPCDNNNIEAVRRLGKKDQKVRPVVISFNTMGYKLKIEKNKHFLHNTSYYIKQDYPIEVLIKRKELQTQLEKEKEQGKMAFIKYDKLIVLDKDRLKSPHSQYNKRNLSEYPEINTGGQQAHYIRKQPDYILPKPKLVFTPNDTSTNHAKITENHDVGIATNDGPSTHPSSPNTTGHRRSCLHQSGLRRTKKKKDKRMSPQPHPLPIRLVTVGAVDHNPPVQKKLL